MSQHSDFFALSIDTEKSIAQIDREELSKQLPHFEGDALVNQQSSNRQDNHQLLKVLLEALELKHDKKIADEKVTTVSKKALLAFGLTCLAGLLCAFLDGIDGIASIIQLLPLSPIFSALVVASFVIISITVFVGFDVTESAKLLGIELDVRESSPFGVISEQKKMIYDINRYLEREIIDAKSDEELENLKSKLAQLVEINAALDNDIEAIDSYMENAPMVSLWRNFAAVSCALLYLNFGFFTGQAGILYLLGNVTMAVVMTQPLLACLVLGGAAVSAFGYAAFYWMVQRPGVENLICRVLYGVDLEALESAKSDMNNIHLSSSLECKQTSIENALANPKLKPEKTGGSAWQSSIGLFSHSRDENISEEKTNDPNYDASAASVIGSMS